ncbi:hypothetical protein BC834DRAFT_846415 [Gloeopeniophorella convolvens]|nr:hypothetical protein BC834DRAFT_846415 [Gloeopeniophorella convolvens]
MMPRHIVLCQMRVVFLFCTAQSCVEVALVGLVNCANDAIAPVKAPGSRPQNGVAAMHDASAVPSASSQWAIASTLPLNINSDSTWNFHEQILAPRFKAQYLWEAMTLPLLLRRVPDPPVSDSNSSIEELLRSCQWDAQQLIPGEERSPPHHELIHYGHDPEPGPAQTWQQGDEDQLNHAQQLDRLDDFGLVAMTDVVSARHTSDQMSLLLQPNSQPPAVYPHESPSITPSNIDVPPHVAFGGQSGDAYTGTLALEECPDWSRVVTDNSSELRGLYQEPPVPQNQWILSGDSRTCHLAKGPAIPWQFGFHPSLFDFTFSSPSYYPPAPPPSSATYYGGYGNMLSATVVPMATENAPYDNPPTYNAGTHCFGPSNPVIHEPSLGALSSSSSPSSPVSKKRKRRRDDEPETRSDPSRKRSRVRKADTACSTSKAPSSQRRQVSRSIPQPSPSQQAPLQVTFSAYEQGKAELNLTFDEWVIVEHILTCSQDQMLRYLCINSNRCLLDLDKCKHFNSGGKEMDRHIYKTKQHGGFPEQCEWKCGRDFARKDAAKAHGRRCEDRKGSGIDANAKPKRSGPVNHFLTNEERRRVDEQFVKGLKAVDILLKQVQPL